MHYRLVLAAILVVSFLPIAGCASIPDTSKINMSVTSVSPDNKYIYGVKTTGERDENHQEHYSLYKANYDFSDPKIIKNDSGAVQISPDGNYLLTRDLVVNDNMNTTDPSGFSVINAKTFETVYTLKDTGVCEHDYDWHPNSQAIWYTTSKNKEKSAAVYMCNLKTKNTEKLTEGIGINWSLDGRYLLLKKIVGDKTRLVLYDRKKKNERVILTEPKGNYIVGILSDDAKTICYSTAIKRHINNKDSITTQVVTRSIDGKSKRVLCSGIHVYEFRIINNNILIAITTTGSTAFDLSTGKKVNPPYIDYDFYNKYTKTVYWSDEETGVLERKKFK